MFNLSKKNLSFQKNELIKVTKKLEFKHKKINYFLVSVLSAEFAALDWASLDASGISQAITQYSP